MVNELVALVPIERLVTFIFRLALLQRVLRLVPAALPLGVVFLVQAHQMERRAARSDDLSVIRPMHLFHSSNLYLSLLFVAVAIDPLLH